MDWKHSAIQPDDVTKMFYQPRTTNFNIDFSQYW